MNFNELEKNTILITYSDDELDDDVKTFKRQVKKRNIQAIETNDGIIESKINAAGPESIKDYLDHTLYLAVFVVSSYFAGIIGEVGAERYKKLTYQVQKFINKIKSKKNVLFIVEIERENNFVLKACFVINKKLSKDQIEQSLNLIPIAIKNISHNIDKYNNEKVLLIKYNGTNWNLDNIEYLKINYGTTILQSNRAVKCFGICAKKYFPEKEDETEWEYLNAKIPPEAHKNALKNIIDYYQRLYTIEDIKYALHFAPLSLSFEMYESFFKAPQGNIPLPQQGEKKITGHCVTLTGYNKKGFQFANSWGEKWGDKGMGLLPYEYVEKYMIEAWGVMMFFRLRKLLRRKKIFSIKFWKEYFKRKKLKGIEKKGIFTDKANRNIKYEVYGCQAMTNTKKGVMVVDLFSPKEKGKYSGWGIFSFNKNDKTIEIEDIFVEPDFCNAGWGTEILKIFEGVIVNLSYTTFLLMYTLFLKPTK